MGVLLKFRLRISLKDERFTFLEFLQTAIFDAVLFTKLKAVFTSKLEWIYR